MRLTGIVDSHAHVSTPRFAEDRAEVLARAREAGLAAIVDVGCDLASSEAAVALAEREPDVWAAVGVHPHEARRWDDASRPALARLAAHPRVVALGEFGLDFHYDHSPRDAQRAAFRAQLELAGDLDMPVVFHIREAYDEALELLAGYPGLRGVAHCFTGTAAQAEGFCALGYAVSFSGVVTFKNAAGVRAAAEAVPADQLLVETDCPYMAPVPVRGKRCEPAFVVHTARFLAELRGEDPEAFAATTRANTARLFGLPLA